MDVHALLAGLPTLGEAELAAQVELAQRYTLVFLRRGPAQRDDEARSEALQLAHRQHLAKLQALGMLVLNGPTLAEHEILGVSIYAAELDQARALAEADPKVIAGYLVVEAIPWLAVPSEVRGA